MSQLPLFDPTELPRLPKGRRVAFRHRELGLCAGIIAGSYPRGYTVWRDGVAKTKPCFLSLADPWPIDQGLQAFANGRGARTT